MGGHGEIFLEQHLKHLLLLEILQFKLDSKELLSPIMTQMGMEFLMNQYLAQEQIQI